jgi:hypothetical protein
MLTPAATKKIIDHRTTCAARDMNQERPEPREYPSEPQMDMIHREMKKYSKPQIRVVDHNGAVVAFERMRNAAPMRKEPKLVKSNGKSIPSQYVPDLERE